MRIRPLRDRIVVRRDDAESITQGGIILPDGAKDKPQKGTVVAVGPGRPHFSGYHMLAGCEPMSVNVGDVVLFTKYSGEGLRIAGEEVFLIKNEDIIAVLDPDDDEQEEPA